MARRRYELAEKKFREAAGESILVFGAKDPHVASTKARPWNGGRMGSRSLCFRNTARGATAALLRAPVPCLTACERPLLSRPA